MWGVAKATEEAQTVFGDHDALRIFDPDHSECQASQDDRDIRLDKATVDYFKSLSEQVNMPYQTQINSYLADCAAKKIKPAVVWG